MDPPAQPTGGSQSVNLQSATPPVSVSRTLEILDPEEIKTRQFQQPQKRINDGAGLTQFLKSKAYRDIGIFVTQLSRAMCPRVVTPPTTIEAPARMRRPRNKVFELGDKRPSLDIIHQLQTVLSDAEELISKAPPEPGPRRFGNIAFRTWHTMLEKDVNDLLARCVPEEIRLREDGPMVELRAYFLGGFGSAQRLDYGTGHELSFMAFLACLWKLGRFKTDDVKIGPGDIARSIVMDVIEP